jgi:hypothetical protein
MAYQSVIVIDDFYRDPDRIRRLALSLPFVRKPGATYPGREAVADRSWEDVRSRLRRYIDEPVDAPCPKAVPFCQGKFRLALAGDQRSRIDRVHVDQQRWSAIVYLTRPGDCRDGLRLYRHRATDSVFWNDDWLLREHPEYFRLDAEACRAAVLGYFKDPRNFELIGTIPMAYNRAVLLMAHALHGTGLAFGTRKENGRLSQHFEFYAGDAGGHSGRSRPKTS